MERKVMIAGGAVFAAIVFLIVFGFFSNSVLARKKQLQAELANVSSEDVEFEPPKWDFEKWEGALAAKPALWKELVEAPPPPPLPPPPPPPVPKLDAMLQGVSVTRQQIGSKVKIITPKDAKGALMGVGDDVNGLKIKEITKTSVIFVYMWEGKELEHELPRK